MLVESPARATLADDPVSMGPTSPSAGSPASEALSARTLDACAWRFASESSKLMLQIVVQIILARLLPVDAFGLLAVASLVFNFGSRLSEIGTGPALIQRAVITPVHVRVAWSLSVCCGVLVTAAVWMGAPFLAALFNANDVTPVLRLIAFVFIIGSIGTTAEALMLRAMDYRRLLTVELISYGIGYTAVGISLALLDWGVWALAWATIAQMAVRTLMLVAMSPHPARPCLARVETGQLLNFGIGITLGRLASFAAQNLDYLIVARMLGTTALGLYSRAYQLMCLPIYQFASIVSSVLFPAYSSIQCDSERLRRGYFGAVSASAIVVFPALAAMGIVAPEIMTGVFGTQWAPASSPLQMLCVAGAFYCIWNLADSLVRAKGAVYARFFCHALYALLVLTFGFTGSRWGITGVAAGVTAATGLACVVMCALSLRLIQAGWRPLLLAQVPGAAIALAVLATELPLVHLLRLMYHGPIGILVVALAVGGMTAMAAVRAMPSEWLHPSVTSLAADGERYGRAALAVARAWLRSAGQPVSPGSRL